MFNILYFLSKTDKSIIKRCPASARNTQASLGFFVLMTGMLALVSGSYAISNMFIYENVEGKPEMASFGEFYSICIGLVYAAFIMAIDREIVSSNTKWTVLLRVPLAIIISLIVSVPAELQIFESRIKKQLLENRKSENDILLADLDSKNQISQLQNDIHKIEEERQKAVDSRSEWAAAMQEETVGKPKKGRTGKSGQGPAYDEAKRNMDLQDHNIAMYDAELAVKKAELSKAKAVNNEQFQNNKVPQSYDLLSKYIALEELKENEKTGSAWRMGWGITLLFMLFELIPSLIKFMLPQNEYDAILDKRTRLNIKATKEIFLQTNSGYEGRPVDEIRDYNPAVVEMIFEAQAV